MGFLKKFGIKKGTIINNRIILFKLSFIRTLSAEIKQVLSEIHLFAFPR